MIRFQKLTGVTLSQTAVAPAITRTPEGIAMGAIPGWAMLFDPAFVQGTNIRNRARRDAFATGSSLPLAEIGGEPVFAPTSVVTMRNNVQGVGLNGAAWTVFSVVRTAASTSFQRVIGNISGNDPSGEISPWIGFSTNGQAAAVSGGPGTRVTYSGNFASRPGLSLVMWTFSTRDGMRIYDNGTLAASAPLSNQPLTHEFGPGQLDAFRFCRGAFGMTGVLDIDLGWAEHAPYRRAIEQFVKAKYEIAAIPA